MLLDTYVFYADVYFVQNFIIKIAVLLLVSMVCRKNMALRKLMVLAFAGTISEIVVLMSGAAYLLFVLWLYLVEVPAISILVVGREKSLWIRACASGYVFTILINGILEVLLNVLGSDAHYVSLLVIACVISVVGAERFLRQRRIEKCIYPVELCIGEERVMISAFYDSGNHLKDPYTGKGVHIVSEEIVKEVVRKMRQKVVIPYKALGNENGLLDGYYIDVLKVYKEDEVVKRQKIPIGLTNDKLFEGKTYKMILNEDIW